MQRIDENTYIDDTLVTCAEYQLFIDEMREHGWSYQPDHWSSYQFPKGNAHEPVLGARHPQAQAFCGWLTFKEAGEWFYRFPTHEEASKYPLKIKTASLALGYWYSEPKFKYFREIFFTVAEADAKIPDAIHWIGIRLVKERIR